MLSEVLPVFNHGVAGSQRHLGQERVNLVSQLRFRTGSSGQSDHLCPGQVSGVSERAEEKEKAKEIERTRCRERREEEERKGEKRARGKVRERKGARSKK